jgi:threonine/homoserine efflux transporter RhtA
MHKNELIALKELPLVGCYLAVAAALLWTLHIIATHYV